MKYNKSSLAEIIEIIFDNPDSDGISFVPINNTRELDIRGFEFNKKSKYKSHLLGHYYHIVLYQADNKGRTINPDNFVAILTDPKVYVLNLIKCNFFGLVIRQNRNSNKMIKTLYKKITDATVSSTEDTPTLKQYKKEYD